MQSIITIFTDRIRKEQEKKSIYNKYIFNSHLIMFLLILFGAVLFNYSTWIEKASKLQLYLVLAILLSVMSYLLAVIKVKTFIKEADAIFLLPQENNYKKIIKGRYIPTILFKVFVALVFIVASKPIVNKVGISNLSTISFYVSLVVSIVIFTIITYKIVIYGEIKNKHLFLIFTSYLLCATIFIIDIINFSIFISLLIYVLLKKDVTRNINWYGASAYDSARLEKYYKLVNMFVDVPIDTVKVKRRKYLDILLPRLTDKNFNKENTYNYYFIRAFLRQENTIFLVVRLFVLSLFFILSLDNVYASLITIIAFNYLSVIQLLPLYRRLGSILWFSVIPVSDNIKLNSFRKMINNILAIFTLLLIVTSLFVSNNIIYLIVSLLVSLVINNYFLNKLK